MSDKNDPKEQVARQKRKLDFQARRKEVQDKILSEESLRVRFQNNEFPGQPLDFNYEGIGYHLDSGKEYDLPYSVIDHLNGLMVPDPHHELDHATGQMRLVSDTARSRFTVHPVVPLKRQLERQAAAGRARA